MLIYVKVATFHEVSTNYTIQILQESAISRPQKASLRYGYWHPVAAPFCEAQLHNTTPDPTRPSPLQVTLDPLWGSTAPLPVDL